MPTALPPPANALRVRGLLLAGLAYAALFARYSWPLGREWSTAFVGIPHHDANQHTWNVGNFQRQVVGGHNPFFTPLLLFPAGNGLPLPTCTPVLGALNLVLHQEFWAVNAGLLLSFVLSGVGAARLVERRVPPPLRLHAGAGCCPPTYPQSRAIGRQWPR